MVFGSILAIKKQLLRVWFISSQLTYIVTFLSSVQVSFYWLVLESPWTIHGIFVLQRTLVDMAADHGCYIDQSQSLNIHMDQPRFRKLTSLHFHAWRKGLKMRMHYLRSRAAANAIQFTVNTSVQKETNTTTVDAHDNS